MNTKIQELLNYAMYEGTELGEVCIKLCSLYERRDMISDVMVRLLEESIEEKLEFFKENSEIVTSDVTEIRQATELIWNDE
ncbi:MAG: hypothetical protein KAR06_03605 [Deltaproteobacteria bacterium]|nr:hypothetical protein [Deltaproteobacteria bacterium]